MRTPADGVISEITQRILVANRTNLWRETSSSSTRWDTKICCKADFKCLEEYHFFFLICGLFSFSSSCFALSLCPISRYCRVKIYISLYIWFVFCNYKCFLCKVTTCHDPIYLSKLQLKRYIINIYAQATKPRQVSLFQLPLLTSLSKPIDASTSHYFHPIFTTIER